MKKIILIILCSLPSFYISAQCLADAGKDIHRCDQESVVVLGGNPTATNGVAPYTYEWSIDPIPTGSRVVPSVYASKILNDTSIANPSVVGGNSFIGSDLTFFLRITDASGCQSVDTMVLTTSIFNIHSKSWNYSIPKGDSVYLNSVPNVSGGYGKATYEWKPSHGLRVTTRERGFWAKPETTTAYAPTVTDSKGCSKTGGDMYFVNVHPLGVDEIFNSKIKIFPNPTSDLLLIRPDHNTNIAKYEFCNLLGQTIAEIDGSQKSIDMTAYQNGVYFLKIYFDNEVLVHRIVKK